MRSQNEESGALIPSSGRQMISPITLEQRIRAKTAFLSEKLEDNTKRAYRDDCNAWERYCRTYGLGTYPVDDVTIVNYIEYLVDEGRALSTIQRRVNGLRAAMKAVGYPFSPETVEAAQTALTVARKRIMKEPGTRGNGKARAFTVPELRAMSDACPDTLRGVRDRALTLLGFAIGARRSELSNLHVADVTDVAAGLEVHIRWSKVGEERRPKVPYGQHLETCPVRAWKAWLAAAGITEGPAFRRIDRHGNLGASITPEGVGDAITELAARAGLGKRTAHGLRSGMATEGRRAKHDAVAIARQGGWTKHSREMLGYMQVIDEWEDNPLYGIGL
ncbi:tyrosine-type recombinase/integrase [Nonomuraea sp. NPDC049400]|uniref:tyrosine-type recombinase/integrase n=1 Tax=Nonomuraea sp. NPDC049400 TaxID=3364352 RepID=UPI00379895DF